MIGTHLKELTQRMRTSLATLLPSTGNWDITDRVIGVSANCGYRVRASGAVVVASLAPYTHLPAYNNN